MPAHFADVKSPARTASGSAPSWQNVRSDRGKTIPGSVKSKLNRLVHQDKRCLISGETGPPDAMTMAHVLDKATEEDIIVRLQYAWGRKVRTNDAWNLFYLRSDLHHAFDHDGWALIPTPELIDQILDKIEEERTRREKDNINTRWPDYRSADWFPCDNKILYEYIFVPLLIADQRVTIARHNCLTACTESPPNITLHFPPAYENFPKLKSHIHPYPVIMNAYPKLQKHPAKVPRNIRRLVGDLGSIYDTWLKAAEEAGALHPAPGTGSHGGSQTGTLPEGSRTDPSDLRSEAHTEPNQDPPAGQNDATHSASNSAGQQEYGEIFDAPHEGLHSPMSISTPDDSASPKGDAICPAALASRFPPEQERPSEADEPVRLPKDMYEWVLGVENARTRNTLVNVANQASDIGRYAEEKVRTPPTEDWHSWRSEYAPWYVVLPKNTGVLSSNDWVEVKNLKPLTRALSSNE